MALDPATSLGLGGLGDQLANQARDETEEQRKKRLRGLFGQDPSGANSIFGSLAPSTLFGSYGR
jgi:hypothetical protein